MDDFYRVPLSTSEATVTVATLRAVCALLQREGVASDIAPEVLESAASRIEAELPDFLSAATEKLRAILDDAFTEANFGTPSNDETSTHPRLPFALGRTRRLLETAWRSSGFAEIEYFVASRNEWSTRRVEISNVYERENGWYVEGECQLRKDHRLFRLENIRAVRIVASKDPADNALPDPFDDEGNA